MSPNYDPPHATMTDELLHAHIDAETDGQWSPVIDQLRRASEENRRRDVERWRHRAAEKVLAEFQLLGFQGFVCLMVDGELTFSGVPAHTPSYLQSETEAA